MKPVAVIGAGITGLTAAFYLKRRGVPVTVYEASGRVGGAIQSVRKDGFLAEFGPNTLLETSPRIGQLVRDAGLESRRLDPDAAAEARYVVRYRRPVEMPAKPLGFFTLLEFEASLPGKTGVEREALTGATVAALTIYDMCKAMSHESVIKETMLVEKTGGKKDFKRKK